MATGQYQDGGYAVSGGDIPAVNHAATDIEAGRIVLLDTTAERQLNPGKPVPVALPTAGGGVAGTFGITVDKLYAPTAAGALRPGRVRLLGSYPVIADGAITAGEAVQASDTVAKLGYAKVCGAALEQVGQALNTVADGEMCWVWIAKARNA